jgi:holo-[acyl-carrier protein] synthase
MRVLGHGVDIVETARIERTLNDHADRFLERCFTERERAYAEGSKRRIEHLAARFAAKEAVMKALGTGWAQGVAWTEIEVEREASGRPSVVLRGAAAERARAMGVREWHLSLSHTGTLAMASVIASGD